MRLPMAVRIRVVDGLLEHLGLLHHTFVRGHCKTDGPEGGNPQQAANSLQRLQQELSGVQGTDDSAEASDGGRSSSDQRSQIEDSSALGLAGRRRLRQFLIEFAREHPGDEMEGYATNATALQEAANIPGCTESDVRDALKTLHQEGVLSLQKWDWFLHGYEPWQDWLHDSFFDSFRLLSQENDLDP